MTVDTHEFSISPPLQLLLFVTSLIFLHQINPTNALFSFSPPFSIMNYSFENSVSYSFSVFSCLKHIHAFFQDNCDFLGGILESICGDSFPLKVAWEKLRDLKSSDSSECVVGTLTARMLCGCVISSSWEEEHTQQEHGVSSPGEAQIPIPLMGPRAKPLPVTRLASTIPSIRLSASLAVPCLWQ